MALPWDAELGQSPVPVAVARIRLNMGSMFRPWASSKAEKVPSDTPLLKSRATASWFSGIMVLWHHGSLAKPGQTRLQPL